MYQNVKQMNHNRLGHGIVYIQLNNTSGVDSPSLYDQTSPP